MRFLSLIVLALWAVPVVAAPSRPSSRIRSLAGRIEITVRADAAPAVLDSLAAAATRLGYEVVSNDAAGMKLRLEKPATLGEVGPLGWKFEGTERRRLDFEAARVKRRPDRLLVAGAITLVSNPGATDEKDQDMGKLQPYRDELKALLEQARTTFGP